MSDRPKLPRNLKAEKQVANDERQLRRAGEVFIFTDGSASVRNKSGGWGALLIHGKKEKRIKGGKIPSTVGEMELMAVYESLRCLRSRRWPVTLFSDSQYVVNALSIWWKGWRRRGWMTTGGTPVKHRELIEEIVDLGEFFEVRYRWVKGHAGNWGNEIADALATEGRLEKLERLS